VTRSEIAVRTGFGQALQLLAERKRRRGETERTLTARDVKLLEEVLTLGPFELLRKLVSGLGSFYRTSDGDLLFFRGGDHRLYDVESTTFERYLVQLTGSPGRVRREWLPQFQAWARFEAEEVTAHFLAYNDSPELNVIAVNTFDGFMMRRERGGAWARVPNGSDGVLFRTPPDFLTPWSPDFQLGGQGRDLAWLCTLGHFADDGPLSVDDQRTLLRVWVLHLFVPALNPVHPIPLHEGVTGSGKSVLGELIGRWLTGPEFEVTDLPPGDSTKAEESLKLALCKRPLVVLDNVDSPARWLEDFLCRVATGVRMSRRRLYTNAEEVHFTPRAGLIITSRDPHFRRDDVARRLLPIQFRSIAPDERRSETTLRAEGDARRARIWADALTALAQIQDGWPSARGHVSPSHSLADFAVFGAIASATGPEHTANWLTLMDRLQQAQDRFAVEHDGLVELLDSELRGTNPVGPVKVSELYERLELSATVRGMPWPYRTTGALTKALKQRRAALEQALQARISISDEHQGGLNHVTITRAAPPTPS
jgi:hypothetical protein